MLSGIPLLIIPFILYNLGLAGSFEAAAGSDLWESELMSLRMMSGGVFSLTVGDALVVIALALLFVEIVKATRTTNVSIVDHLLSTFVFVAFLVEFLLVQAAAALGLLHPDGDLAGRRAGRLLGVAAFGRARRQPQRLSGPSALTPSSSILRCIAAI